MNATGPDAAHIATVSAEVLEYGSVKGATITDFLGAMSSVFGRADGTRVRTWLLDALPDAQRRGYAETDIGDSYYRLTFEDTGASSATFLSVSSVSGPPVPPTEGPISTGSGISFFGMTQGRPGGWATFDDPGGKYSIAFPGQPTKIGPQQATGADGPVSRTSYEWASTDKQTTYTVSATDYPEGALRDKDQAAFLQGVADQYQAAFHADPSGRYATNVGGHVGLDMAITNTKGFVCLRFVIIGDRLYALGGTETHQCPSYIAGFLGSFEVKGT